MTNHDFDVRVRYPSRWVAMNAMASASEMRTALPNRWIRRAPVLIQRRTVRDETSRKFATSPIVKKRGSAAPVPPLLFVGLFVTSNALAKNGCRGRELRLLGEPMKCTIVEDDRAPAGFRHDEVASLELVVQKGPAYSRQLGKFGNRIGEACPIALAFRSTPLSSRGGSAVSNRIACGNDRNVQRLSTCPRVPVRSDEIDR
jgi:hypothetical protein